MVLPKVTRQRIYAARGRSLEVSIPEGEPCAKLKRYAIQSKRGGRHLGTLFVQALEHRGSVRIATVYLTDEPRFMAKVSGTTPDPSQSIDPDAEMVPDDVQKRITAEAHIRDANYQDTHSAQTSQLRSVIGTVRETTIQAHRAGVDTRPFLEDVQRGLGELREQMRG